MSDHRSFLAEFSPQALLMGLLVAFVGFASTFAVVLHGLKAVGASDAEASSGLMAVSVAMGLCGLVLSLRTRMPISVAWSTPGAAVLVTAGVPQGGFSEAVGAFILSAILLTAAGLFRPLSRAVSAIPPALANAMLAGVLVGLCFAPVKAIAGMPALALPIVVVFFGMAAWKRLYAVPAALLTFILVIAIGLGVPEGFSARFASALAPPVTFVWPSFSLASAISIAVPLFIVTMASQNIPGITVLRVNHFHPDPAPLFSLSGLFSLLAAPFGSHAVNLAAITAAMCAGPDAHPDPKRRYWAAIVAGITYVVFGLGAGAVTAIVTLAPTILIETVAGLALVSAFVGAAANAFKDESNRDAAAVTFIVTAEGIGFLGVSGAFWGLLAGGSVMALSGLIKRLVG